MADSASTDINMEDNSFSYDDDMENEIEEYKNDILKDSVILKIQNYPQRQQQVKNRDAIEIDEKKQQDVFENIIRSSLEVANEWKISQGRAYQLLRRVSFKKENIQQQLYDDIFPVQNENNNDLKNTNVCLNCSKELVSDKFYYSLCCNHRYCIPCFAHLMQENIDINAKCPYYNCQERIGINEAQQFYSLPQLQKYQKQILEDYHQSMGIYQSIPCPKLCGRIHKFMDIKDDKSIEKYKLECSCSPFSYFCGLCSNKFHYSLTCDQFDQFLQLKNEEERNEKGNQSFTACCVEYKQQQYSLEKTIFYAQKNMKKLSEKFSDLQLNFYKRAYETLISSKMYLSICMVINFYINQYGEERYDISESNFKEIIQEFQRMIKEFNLMNFYDWVDNLDIKDQLLNKTHGVSFAFQKMMVLNESKIQHIVDDAFNHIISPNRYFENNQFNQEVVLNQEGDLIQQYDFKQEDYLIIQEFLNQEENPIQQVDPNQMVDLNQEVNPNQMVDLNQQVDPIQQVDAIQQDEPNQVVDPFEDPDGFKEVELQECIQCQRFNLLNEFLVCEYCQNEQEYEQAILMS